VLNKDEKQKRIVGIVKEGISRLFALVVADLVDDLVLLVGKHFRCLLGSEHRTDFDSPVELLHLVRGEKLYIGAEYGGVVDVELFQLVLWIISLFLLGILRIQIKTLSVETLKSPEN
jgi:hypothetical protein